MVVWSMTWKALTWLVGLFNVLSASFWYGYVSSHVWLSATSLFVPFELYLLSCCRYGRFGAPNKVKLILVEHLEDWALLPLKSNRWFFLLKMVNSHQAVEPRSCSSLYFTWTVSNAALLCMLRKYTHPECVLISNISRKERMMVLSFFRPYLAFVDNISIKLMLLRMEGVAHNYNLSWYSMVVSCRSNIGIISTMVSKNLWYISAEHTNGGR